MTTSPALLTSRLRVSLRIPASSALGEALSQTPASEWGGLLVQYALIGASNHVLADQLARTIAMQVSDLGDRLQATGLATKPTSAEPPARDAVPAVVNEEVTAAAVKLFDTFSRKKP